MCVAMGGVAGDSSVVFTSVVVIPWSGSGGLVPELPPPLVGWVGNLGSGGGTCVGPSKSSRSAAGNDDTYGYRFPFGELIWVPS